MGLYEQGFSRLGQVCGQVLLAPDDFDDRLRYLNLRSTLLTLLRHGVVPVINENNAVSTEELAFEEGQPRAVLATTTGFPALVATKLGADLLVLLTDVDGVFDRDPRSDPAARLLLRVDVAGAGLDSASGGRTALGRGGMRSKVEAAHVAARAGCQAVVASGVEAGALTAVLDGEEVGTWFPARGELAADGAGSRSPPSHGAYWSSTREPSRLSRSVAPRCWRPSARSRRGFLSGRRS